jgi:hypothetical protein
VQVFPDWSNVCCKTGALPTNIRLSWKGSPETNTILY